MTASTGSRERRSGKTNTDLFKTSEEKIIHALEVLDRNSDLLEWDYCYCETTCPQGHSYIPSTVEEAIGDLRTHVPKLLEAYTELFRLSLEVTKLVKDERAGRTPSGLVVPK